MLPIISENSAAAPHGADAMTPKRECGACTACCTVMGVSELKKKNYQRCCYLTERCSIYAARPAGCRDWSCNWLLGILEGDERRRPDNFGLMFTNELKGDKVILTAYEVWEGASKQPKARFLLDKLQEKWPVCVVDTKNNFVILWSDPQQRKSINDLVAKHALIE
jgi:hypothetical protein